MKGISDQDYEYAQQVWNRTTPMHENITLGDYHDTFQNTGLKKYKFDPASFYTASGLAWQALLKTTSEYFEHEKRRKDCKLCPDLSCLQI